jgi:hypothetical protein
VFLIDFGKLDFLGFSFSLYVRYTFNGYMQVLFVISATLWAWLVGRAIVFGLTTKSLFWHPNMHASTWYRLTPIPCNIPHQHFPFIAPIIAIIATPTLFIENNTIHIITVLRLVLEHAYIPLWVAHVHSNCTLTAWPCITLAIAILTIALLIQLNTIFSLIAIPFTAASCAIHIWFIYMQLYIILKQPIVRKEQPYEARQPRIV